MPRGPQSQQTPKPSKVAQNEARRCVGPTDGTQAATKGQFGGAGLYSPPMTIETGDRIKIHYRGKLKEGDQFDSSYERGDPLEFTAGSQELIPAVSTAVIGMAVGEKKTVDVPPNLGYGERNDEMIVRVQKEQLPEGATIGTMLQIELPEDQGKLTVVLTEIEDEEAVLDGNHPLAGKHLIFDLEIVEILPKP